MKSRGWIVTGLILLILSTTSGPTYSTDHVGLPLRQYCAKYVSGLTFDLSSYENFLKTRKAATEISAKGHTNANQVTREDGLATYRVHPDSDKNYDGTRYTVHFVDLESVARRFGYSPLKSEDHRLLWLALRLHDTPEDTPITVNDIATWFNWDLANLVDSVKKVDPSDTVSESDAKQLTIKKVLGHRLGVRLKLIDRIANVERGLRSGQILPKYIRDHAAFRSMLYQRGDDEEMWRYLDSLIGTQKFPDGVDYWTWRLDGLRYDRLPTLEGKKYSSDEKNAVKMPMPGYRSPPENITLLSTASIHFMQRYVNEHLGHRKYSLIETAHALKNQELPIADFPPLQVWQDVDGKIWTLDHRRLAAIRLAGNIAFVRVIWATPQEVEKDAYKFEPWKNGKTVQILLEGDRVVVPKIQDYTAN
jgi:hypothetical protein